MRGAFKNCRPSNSTCLTNTVHCQFVDRLQDHAGMNRKPTPSSRAPGEPNERKCIDGYASIGPSWMLLRAETVSSRFGSDFAMRVHGERCSALLRARLHMTAHDRTQGLNVWAELLPPLRAETTPVPILVAVLHQRPHQVPLPHGTSRDNPPPASLVHRSPAM